MFFFLMTMLSTILTLYQLFILGGDGKQWVFQSPAPFPINSKGNAKLNAGGKITYTVV